LGHGRSRGRRANEPGAFASLFWLRCSGIAASAAARGAATPRRSSRNRNIYPESLNPKESRDSWPKAMQQPKQIHCCGVRIRRVAYMLIVDSVAALRALHDFEFWFDFLDSPQFPQKPPRITLVRRCDSQCQMSVHSCGCL
jgi:hypothetical protein